MNFQSEHGQPHFGMPAAHNPDTEVLRELMDSIREINYHYSENIRYHTRIMESYNQNVNLIIMLLHSLYPHVLQSRRSRSPAATRDRGTRRERSPSWTNVFTRIPAEPRLETDLSSLMLYLFTNGNPLLGGGRGGRPMMTPPLLTMTQIDQSTELVRYNEAMGERICPISMENFEENEQVCRIRGCRHIFKRDHLMRWLQTSVNCPVCRYDLRDFSNNPINVERRDSIDVPNPRADRDGYDMRFFDRSENVRPGMSIHTDGGTHIPPINLFSDGDTHNISQLLTNLLRNSLPTTDASNNLLYTLEIPLG